MNTKRQTPEQMMRSALRLQRGLDLLNNPAYSFTPFATNPEAFFVEKTDGTIYLTSVQTTSCTCEDFKRAGEACKHLYACKELVEQAAQCEAYDPNEVDAGIY